MNTELEIGHEDVKENAKEMDSANTSLMSLPAEMLLKIMDQLPSADRAQCRLVSREWNYSVGAVYEQKERICITSFYNDCLDEVWSTLSRSTRSLLHFEFRRLTLLGADGETETAFWRACGPKILSLKLSLCQGTRFAFMSILRHCSNLQTLEFRYRSMREMISEEGLSIICLRECVQLRLQNTSLRNLSIRFEDKYEFLPDTIEDELSFYYLETLCQLFSLFSSVSHFSSSQHDGISYCSRFRGKSKRFDKDGAEPEYIARLHEYFVRDQMESIAIPWLGLEWNEWTSFMRALCTKTTKITEIIISDSENWTLESFSGFVSRQTNLQKVTCVFAKRLYTKDEFEEAALRFLTLLRNVPSVRHLRLVSLIFLRWKGNWSKIGLMKWGVTADDDVSVRKAETLNKPFPILAKLTSCKIEVSGLNDFGETVVSMLGSFPSLTHLYLDRVNKDILKSVLINQLKLKSFTVGSVDSKDALPSTNFIDQFKNLQFLEVPQRLNLLPQNISNLKVLRVVRRRTSMPQFIFPKFPLSMFLLTNRYTASDAPILRQYLMAYQSACPCLEVACFELDCNCIVEGADNSLFEERLNNDCRRVRIRNFLANFIADLKNLKYLHLANYKPLLCDRISFNLSALTDEDISQIFQQSRSLRMLAMTEDKIYFKHAIKNCVIRATMQDLDVRATEFSELFVASNNKIVL